MASKTRDRASRVLVVLHSFGIGGMETTAIDLATELARRGCDIRVVIPEGDAFDTIADRATAGGVHVHRLTTDARRDGWLGARLLRFARLLASWRPDVVHLHTGGATGGLGVIAVARIASRAATVVTEHDAPTETPPLSLRGTAWLRDRCRHTLVAVSRRNARLRREWLPTPVDRFAAILNGIPVPASDPAERAEERGRLRRDLGIGDDDVAIGSVVRLAEGKGLHELLRAFAEVHGSTGQDSTGQDSGGQDSGGRGAGRCRLVLVGDGPLRGELERLADELGVRQAVRFAGFQRDPVPYFYALDVFALAVPDGTGSIAMLQAMAAGLPTVITFCGPDEAVIHEETGLCSPPSDAPALAAALRRFVNDPDLRTRLGAAAATHVRQHFSIRRVADDYLELYRTARTGPVPARLRADRPPTPRPGG